MRPKDKPQRPLIKKHYVVARKHPATLYFFILIFMLIVAAAIYHLLSNTTPLRVTPNSKIVIINHDGYTQTVPSDDKTVGALLSRLHIPINKGDVVAPALNTAINQDEFRINIYRAEPVAIVENGNTTFTMSAATTPRAIAEQSGINVYPQDIVTTEPSENFLADRALGEQVVIDPATPVNVNLYGNAVVLRTHASTVAELLKENNIKLGPSDQITPALNSTITPNTLVVIYRKGVKVETVTQTIPMTVDVEYTDTLAFGTSSVIQQGSNGTEVITYQDNLVNGQVASRTILQTVVTTPPVTEIVDEGTSLSGIQGDMALAGIPPGDYQYADYIISHESGWCPTKWQGEHTCPPTFEPLYSIYSAVGYGLGQSTPAANMSAFGSDWETDPVTQLKWANAYANSHYGGWYGAYEHWLAYSWW